MPSPGHARPYPDLPYYCTGEISSTLRYRTTILGSQVAMSDARQTPLHGKKLRKKKIARQQNDTGQRNWRKMVLFHFRK